MSRSRAEAFAALVLFVLVAWAGWEAQDWDLRARLFPVVVAIPVLGLLLIYLAQTLSGRRTEAAPTDEPEPDPRPGAMRRGFAMVGWIAAFAIAVWLMGFRIGAPLMVFVYLRATGESWKVCAVYAACTYLVVTFAFDRLLGLEFPRGLLQRLFGLDHPYI